MTHLRGFALALLAFNFSNNGDARYLGEIESSVADTSHLGEEKLTPEAMCTLIGGGLGCEKKDTIPNIVGVIDSSMLDPNHIGEEKLTPEAMCSLIGGGLGCEMKGTIPNIVIDHSSTDQKERVDSSMLYPSHFGEEKLTPEAMCSLLGGGLGCEMKDIVPNIVIDHSSTDHKGKVDSSMLYPIHFGEEKLTPEAMCSLLGGGLDC